MSFRGPNNQYNTDSSDSDSDPNFPISSADPEDFPINILNNTVTMAVSNQSQTPVLKQEYLNMVPEFNGETELLPRFIEICEKLVNKFYNAQDVNDFQNEYLMSSILAKIKGEAAINISSCIINNWLDLKNALINTYSDKRDCYSLNIEMTELKQEENETPFEFYGRVQRLLNLQISYFTTHVTANESSILCQFFRNFALRILLRGLSGQIGSLMRTKNPDNLNIALHMLTNDFQLETTKQKHDKNKFHAKNNYHNKTPLKNQPLRLTNFPHNNNLQYVQNPRPNYNQQTQPFRTNNFSNQSRNVNVFKSNPNQSFPKQIPMSISTRNTYQPQNRNTNFRQNYIAEELHNIDDQPSVEFPVDENNVEDENNFLGKIASDHISN